jgi:hypothetical protein
MKRRCITLAATHLTDAPSRVIALPNASFLIDVRSAFGLGRDWETDGNDV